MGDGEKRKLLEKLDVNLSDSFTPQSFFNSLLSFVQKEIFSNIDEGKFSEMDKQAWIRQLGELRERILELKGLKSRKRVDLVSKKVTMEMTQSLNKASYGKSLRRREYDMAKAENSHNFFLENKHDEESCLQKSGKRNPKSVFKHEGSNPGRILNIEKFKIFVKKDTRDPDLKSIDELNNQDSSEGSELEEEDEEIFQKEGDMLQEGNPDSQFFSFDTSICHIKELVEDLITSTSSTSIFGEEKCKKVVKKILKNLHEIADRLHKDSSFESQIRMEDHFEPIIKNFNPKFNIPCYKPQGYLTVYGRELKCLAEETQKSRKLSQNEHQNMIANIAFLGLLALAKYTKPDSIYQMIKRGEKEMFQEFFLTKIFRKIILKLYKIRPDYHLYVEHLLVYKTILKIHSKILEFFSVEMFNKLKIQNSITVSNIEFGLLKYLLTSSRASCSFFREFVLSFIQRAVSLIPPNTT